MDIDIGASIILIVGRLVIVTLLIGWIPALIAKRKGRNFAVWLIYGGALFIVALIHALLMSPLTAAELEQEEERTRQTLIQEKQAEETRRDAEARENAKIDHNKQHQCRTAGAIFLVIALPWLAIIFSKYNAGPYVSTGKAIIDCLPLFILAGAAALLSVRPKLKIAEPGASRVRASRARR